MSGAGDDDLDALVPPPPVMLRIGGQDWPLPPLTFQRYAAARRFCENFAAVLRSGDPMAGFEDAADALADHFARATLIPRAVMDEADSAEAIRAGFALVRAYSDFTAGPLVAALAGGMIAHAGAAALSGDRSSPGSSDADTASPK